MCEDLNGRIYPYGHNYIYVENDNFLNLNNVNLLFKMIKYTDKHENC